MGALFEHIRGLVIQGRYVVGQHAWERLDERSIMEWQVVDGIELGSLISERPRDLPNPIVEINETLVDGTEIKAVWCLLISVDIAKLVTVHFYEE